MNTHVRIVVALFIAAASAGCQGNFMSNLLTGQTVCEDAVARVYECCKPQFEGEVDTFAVCNTLLDYQKQYYDIWETLRKQCLSQDLNLSGHYGVFISAAKAADMACPDLLADLYVPPVGTDGDTEVEESVEETPDLQEDDGQDDQPGDEDPDIVEEEEEDQPWTDGDDYEPPDDQDLLPDEDWQDPEPVEEVEQVCSPFAIVCDAQGRSVMCNANGMGWQTPRVCNDNKQCTADSCQEGVGCVYDEGAMNGQQCNDDNQCTVNDSCHQGQCGGAVRDCTLEIPSSIDPQCINLATNVYCLTTSGCQFNTHAQDSTTCNDGFNCTGNDTCYNGQCAGISADCSHLGDGQCLRGVCIEATGQCGVSNINEGLGCDDSNRCTENTLCVQGQCKGATVNCADTNECNIDECNPAIGCTYRTNTAMQGLACNDRNACTAASTCNAGLCTGQEKDCLLELPAIVSSQCLKGYQCNRESGLCQFQYFDATKSCSDGNKCTYGDVCNGVTGACAGLTVDCSHLNNLPCSLGACESATGYCGVSHINEGHNCQDANPCTTSETCIQGVCTPGGTLSCEDYDQCTVDSCDVNAGFGDPCRHTQRQCLDANPCTDDLCNTATGCYFPVVEGRSCRDNLVCNGGDETCDALGQCLPLSLPPDCQGLSTQCTVGVCSEDFAGCITEDGPDNIPCEDGDPVTFSDICRSGVCIGGVILPTAISFASSPITLGRFFTCASEGGVVNGDVSVSLTINHPRGRDLVISLYSPGLKRWKLFDQQDINGLIQIDLASSRFFGNAADGRWYLEITDGVAADDGVLDAFSMTIPCGDLPEEVEAEPEADGDEEMEETL